VLEVKDSAKLLKFAVLDNEANTVVGYQTVNSLVGRPCTMQLYHSSVVLACEETLGTIAVLPVFADGRNEVPGLHG
jgi:hypothetical protein